MLVNINYFCLFVTIVALLPMATNAEVPSTSCPDHIMAITITAGERIPLVAAFSNPTSRTVDFEVTMLDNVFFGPRRVVQTARVGPISAGTASVGTTYPTTINTPTRKAMLTLEVTTNREADGVVGRCKYQVTIDPPAAYDVRHPILGTPEKRHLIQIPIRMCVLEGTRLAAQAEPGETISGTEPYDWLLEMNETIWMPKATIAFSSAIDTEFPVIEDPASTSTCRIPGAIADSGTASNGEPAQAAATCAAAWDETYPGRKGLPVVLVRDICTGEYGLSSGAPPEFKPGGRRFSDLCHYPRRLNESDFTDPSHPDYMVIIEKGPQSDAASGFSHTLAHELGHNLFLGHGNGLDDDNDGERIGLGGPRLYDDYCDTDEGYDPEAGCGSGRLSLMYPEGTTCNAILPHQVETARDVGRLLPGSRDHTPTGRVFDPN